MLTAKKALSVLMALVICLGIVCACSPKTENTPSTTEQTTEIAKVTFVFAVTGKDGKVKEYTVSTSEKYLADAPAAFDEGEADPNMEKLWRAYQKKFSYAADLSWHTVMESIRSLYELARE